MELYEHVEIMKFAGSGAKSVVELAAELEALARLFREMAADGVEFDADGSDGGFFFFFTADPAVAAKYGMRKCDFDEFDAEGDEDDAGDEAA